MLVSDLNNVRYLSGFTGSNAALLVFADNRPALLATDGRYRTQATAQAPDLETVITRSLGAALGRRAADDGRDRAVVRDRGRRREVAPALGVLDADPPLQRGDAVQGRPDRQRV